MKTIERLLMTFAALILFILFFLGFLFLPLITKADDLAKPPLIEPYELPTLLNNRVDHYKTTPPLDQVNLDLNIGEIFQETLNCYPMPNRFKLDVNLVGGISNQSMINNLDNTVQGKYYAGIVLSMPLYSTTEIDRQATLEIRIRETITKNITDFVNAISMSIMAHREFGLFSSLESRAQIRVKKGVTDTKEQVDYLEKVVNAQTKVIEWDTKLEAARISLTSLCRESERNKLDGYLKDYVKEKGVKFIKKN